MQSTKRYSKPYEGPSGLAPKRVWYSKIIRPLYLKMADYGLFTDPFGPTYPDTVAYLYTPSDLPYGFEAHNYKTYIKRIDGFPNQEIIDKISKSLRHQGVSIHVQVLHHEYNAIVVVVDTIGRRGWDLHPELDGTELRLVLHEQEMMYHGE